MSKLNGKLRKVKPKPLIGYPKSNWFGFEFVRNGWIIPVMGFYKMKSRGKIYYECDDNNRIFYTMKEVKEYCLKIIQQKMEY